MAGGGGYKKIFQYCSDSLGILYLRAFQGHSGRNLIDPFFLRTVPLFRTVSSSTFITSDVQSIYSPSSTSIDTGRTEFWATDRQYSFFRWIPFLRRSTWNHRVLHGTCTKHERNIQIRCIGSTSTLLWRKDWNSIRQDRTPSTFTKHSQLSVTRKLFGWKLEKSFSKTFLHHLGLLQRFLWNMSGRENWVRSCSTSRRRSCSTIKKGSHQANQIPAQIMKVRRMPLFVVMQITRQVHFVLRKSTHVLFMKKLWITTERGDPLFAEMQISSAQPLFALNKRLIHVSLVNVRTWF